jgi:uncharacterized membrane protein
MSVKSNNDLIRDLHVRNGSLRNVFIANVTTAFVLFSLLVTSLVLLISEGSASHSKAIVDLFLSIFFFIAVVLLIVSDMFGDIKTNGYFNG